MYLNDKAVLKVSLFDIAFSLFYFFDFRFLFPY